MEKSFASFVIMVMAYVLAYSLLELGLAALSALLATFLSGGVVAFIILVLWIACLFGGPFSIVAMMIYKTSMLGLSKVSDFFAAISAKFA